MKAPKNTFTFMLFIAYALILIGIVLFKLPFSIHGIEDARTINLIPLMGSFADDGRLNVREIIENVIVFVPFGIYVCMLKSDWSFAKKLASIIGTTLAFEIIQFIFAIGISDITDILGNTLGGIIGIGMYTLLTRILKGKTNKIINIAALILTVGALLLLIFLMSRTMGMIVRASGI